MRKKNHQNSPQKPGADSTRTKLNKKVQRLITQMQEMQRANRPQEARALQIRLTKIGIKMTQDKIQMLNRKRLNPTLAENELLQKQKLLERLEGK